jgi:hypothetical protein
MDEPAGHPGPPQGSEAQRPTRARPNTRRQEVGAIVNSWVGQIRDAAVQQSVLKLLGKS